MKNWTDELNSDMQRLPFKESERLIIHAKLLSLLDQRAALHAQLQPKPDEKEKAQLLRSLLYSLSLDFDNPDSFRPLLFELPEVRLENAQYELTQKADCARHLACSLLRALPLPSLIIKKTLDSILRALNGYDVSFFAHRLDAAYAYPLLRPVPADLQGVDYALSYLVFLSAELSLLRVFPMHRAAALLDGAMPDWRTSDINLLSPLLFNALALTMLGKNPKRLHVSSADRETLFALLALKNTEQLESSLLCVFPDTAKALGLDDPDQYALLLHAAKALAPLAYAACKKGDLCGVFASFALPGG